MTDEKKIDITENDQKLAHTVFDHLIYEAYNGLLTALEESAIMKSEDDRYKKLYLELTGILNELDESINSALDTIPGIPTREEAEVQARKLLDTAGLLKGYPPGSLTSEPEIKH